MSFFWKILFKSLDPITESSTSSHQHLLKNKDKAQDLIQILQMRKERNLVYFRGADYLDKQKDIKMKNWLYQTNSDYEKLSKLPDLLPLDKYIKL